MALIDCPECNGKVSTFALNCPHCGCPVRVMENKKEKYNAICMIKNKSYDLSELITILDSEIDNNKKNEVAINYIRQTTAESDDIVMGLWYIVTHKKEIPTHYMCPNNRLRFASDDTPNPQPAPNVPKCPTCGSTSLDKITAFDRGVAAGVFGMISKTARSQFRCRSCGYMF